MNTKPALKSMGVSLLAITASMSGASYAVAQDGSGAAQLDEIIVTARRKSENIQSTPITVSAFNANTLENLGVTDNLEIARFTPSVIFDNTSSFAGIDSFQAFIRGVGQTDFALNTDPGVGLYIDGVYIARAPGAVTELLDIERIEVLKGPQGTLFGRNAIGGAVSIVTQKPSDEFFARGSVRYGTFNNVEVSGVINTPLTENINASVAFSADTIDGFQERIPFDSDFAALGPFQGAPSTSVPLDQILTTGTSSGRDPGAKAGGTIRAKVAWDVTEDVDFVFSADTTIRRDAANPTTLLEVDGAAGLGGLFNGCNSLGATPITAPDGTVLAPPRSALPCLSDFLPTTVDGDGNVVGINFDGSRPDQLFNEQFITGDIDQTFATGANFADSTSQGISGEVNWRINDNVSFTSITAYRELESAFGLDIDSSPLSFDQTTFTLDTEQFSQEIQFNVNWGDRLDATLGGFYFNEDGAQLDAVAIAGGLIQVAGGFDQETTAWAGFGEANYEIVDGIKLIFGGRFTTEEKSLNLDQQNLNTTVSPLISMTAINPLIGGPNSLDLLPRPGQPEFLAADGTLSETFNNFSIRVGANWQVTDDLFTFATFSQGFKSGGFITRLTDFVSAEAIAQADPTDPSILRSLTFDEETSDNYEVGFKANLADNRIRINGSAFWNQYDDIQVVVQRGVSPSNENIAEARIRGFELDAEALITEELRVNATFGYLDAEYRAIDPNAAPLLVNRFGQNIDLDTPLQNTPEVTASVAVNYELTQDLSVNGNFSYVSEVTNDPFAVENLVQSGYSLFGASAAYDPDANWNLRAGVTNIGDERFIVSGFEGGGLPFTIGSFNRGREFYVQFGYDF